jgi:predicted PurR-regulated permease PerM
MVFRSFNNADVILEAERTCDILNRVADYCMDNLNNNVDRPNISPYEIAAWLLVAAALLISLKIHLLPALLSGLLVFELVHTLSPHIRLKSMSGYRAKIVVVAVLAFIVIITLCLLIFGVAAFFRGSSGSLPILFQKMADIIEGSLKTLPAWVVAYLPSDAEGVKTAIVSWLREHAGELQLVGKEAIRTAAHILVGMIVGALIALDEVGPGHAYGPLSRALIERFSRLGLAFHRVVFAQIRISAINTLFTLIYLGIVLPLFGVHLPFTKTLILITFVTGLLPVIGNLISNTIIVTVSFSHSINVVISSFVFLIAIHKFEYFLNARIVGSQIRSKTWEILLAMVIMEAAFGIQGVIAAPIYYAYLKDELMSRELI